MPSIFDEPVTSYGKCRDCELPQTSYYWCNACEAKSFRRRSQTWSETKNAELNHLFRVSQCAAERAGDFIEHIPYSQLEEDLENNDPVSGAHSTVKRATWLEGPPINFNGANNEWERTGPTKVALKRIHNSQTPDYGVFLQKVTRYYKALQDINVTDTFGISLNPSNELVVVMRWYDTGNLYEALAQYECTFEAKVRLLFEIASGLESLHDHNLHHGNIHGGNILVEVGENGEITAKLADVGICGPANQSDQTSEGVFGVLPYVAPEVLLGEALGKASDVYSFGILMWQIATARRPFGERPHDLDLAIRIVNGLRPDDITELFPEDFVGLMNNCWHANPERRRTAAEINGWLCEYSETVRLLNDDTSGDCFVSDVHDEACYTSRFLSFPELRELVFTNLT